MELIIIITYISNMEYHDKNSNDKMSCSASLHKKIVILLHVSLYLFLQYPLRKFEAHWD